MPNSQPTSITRYAVVTGGGSGIGRDLCRQLAELGYRVAVVDCDSEAAKETQTLLATANESLAVAMDVVSASEWQQLVADLRQQWPRLDLLVNNAGVLLGGELAAAASSQLQRVIDVNLTGTMHGCAAMIPWLIESAQQARCAKRSNLPQPGIINTASIFASVSPPGFAAYNASKAGVIALSETLRGELTPHGLNVTVTLPGVVKTSLFAGADFSNAAYHAAAQRFLANAQLEPEQVATETLAAAARGQLHAVIGRYAKWYWRLKNWLPSVTIKKVANRAHQELRTQPDSQ